MSTAVDRPLPPTNLNYVMKKDNDFKVVYGIGVTLPEEYFVDGQFMGNVTATVNTINWYNGHKINQIYSTIYQPPNHVTIDSMLKIGAFIVPVQDMILNSVDGRITVDVKLTLFGLDSDWTKLKSSNESCEVPVHIGEWKCIHGQC